MRASLPLPVTSAWPWPRERHKAPVVKSEYGCMGVERWTPTCSVAGVFEVQCLM